MSPAPAPIDLEVVTDLLVEPMKGEGFYELMRQRAAEARAAREAEQLAQRPW